MKSKYKNGKGYYVYRFLDNSNNDVNGLINNLNKKDKNSEVNLNE